MIYTYEKDFTITYSQIDRWLELDLVSAALIGQQMNTEYFRSFGSDNFTVSQKDNCVWVITKNRIHYYRVPKWSETLKGTATTIKTRGMRSEIQLLFHDQSGALVLSVKQELCVIDLAARTIKNIAEISYPKDMEFAPEPQPIDYFRLRDDLPEDCLVYTDTFRLTDIDYSNHVNNVVYVRHLLDAVNPTLFEKNRVVDFEIHYHHECLEGHTYGVYLRDNGDQSIDLQLSSDGTSRVKARLTYCPR